MLEVDRIVKYYKKTKGVEGLSFKLKPKKALGIIGNNGSGKTTTFRVLLGLLKADSGTITFNSKPLSMHPISLFGYLPEERSLYKELTVYDQVMLLGRLKKMSDDLISKRLNDFLIVLKISDYKYTKISKLSKGNQQKVQILCAIIHDPSILILDEPLSGLDIINVQLLKNLIINQKNKGKYILLSSHQFDHIQEFCDDIIILKAGSVQFSGSVDDLIRMSKYHYLTLDKDIATKYLTSQHIVDTKRIGKLIRLKIEGKHNRDAIFKEVIENEDVHNISISDASIEEVVRERQLI